VAPNKLDLSHFVAQNPRERRSTHPPAGRSTAYSLLVRGQAEVPLDPDVVLGDLGGAGVSDFMTALRKNSYTPKKARSAAQALVDKMKQEALRNPKREVKWNLSAVSPTQRRVRAPVHIRQPFRPAQPNQRVKIEPKWDAEQTPQFVRASLMPRTPWKPSQYGASPSRPAWNILPMTPISPVKIERASENTSPGFGPVRNSRPSHAQPYELPALERDSATPNDTPLKGNPQNWSELLAKK
jgi:hypothetical protein